MQYPDDLMKIARRLVAIAHDVPRAPEAVVPHHALRGAPVDRPRPLPGSHPRTVPRQRAAGPGGDPGVVAANRRLPTTLQPTDQPSDPLEFPVGDGELATILADFYSGSPHVVAEVLRALRREKHPGRKWLLKTLRATPGLTKLAKKVDRLIEVDSAD